MILNTGNQKTAFLHSYPIYFPQAVISGDAERPNDSHIDVIAKQPHYCHSVNWPCVKKYNLRSRASGERRSIEIALQA